MPAIEIVTDDVIVGDALVLAGRRRGFDLTRTETPSSRPDVAVLDLRQALAVPVSTLDELFEHLAAGTHGPSDDAATARHVLEALTRRERELCRHLLAGHGTAELAVRLGISDRTVQTHLQNIFSKLGLTGRAQLIAWAANAGLTPPDPT